MDPNYLISQLKRSLKMGEIDNALALEAHLYDKLVKPVEDETHYFRCFQQWQGAFEEAAQRSTWQPSTGPKVGFVVHSDSAMAHTRIVLKTCELRPRGVECCVFVLSGDTGQLRREFNPLGVRVFYLARPGDGVSIQLHRLRSIAQSVGVGTLTWVSLPLWASYAFATRLAMRQVFWALRFHPLKGNKFTDLYVTPGKRSETTRTYNGQSYRVCHTPLCIDIQGVAQKRALELGTFAPKYGTVGRSEKIAHPEFMEAVRRIIDNDPGSGFCWTGHRPLPAVSEALQGRPNQFVGWVDPLDYISGLDCYLETFPSGGLATMSAWAAGVPAVGLVQPQSPYGSIDAPHLGGASDIDGYVSLAKYLARDGALRQSVIEGQHKALEEEQERAGEDVARWWDLVRQ